MRGAAPSVTVVIPTIGRPGVGRLVSELDDERIDEVVVVDDRRDKRESLGVEGRRCRVVETPGGRGPAFARNVGWRTARSEWVAFLDDDVVPEPDWVADLLQDLAVCRPITAASQGRVKVPIPVRPTDWERNVAALASAPWITADMAVRRSALRAVAGFDPRFRRAYREDSDLALRFLDAGWELSTGRRTVSHTVRSAPWWMSVALQRGNADDVLMARLHGDDWRQRCGAASGLLSRHMATVAALLVALAGRGRLRGLAAAVWVLLTTGFAWRRIGPGPRTPRETAAMVATSVAIPPAATLWHLLGRFIHRRAKVHRVPVDAVLFDRDGTLVVDVPYNGDPEAVELVPGAREAVDLLRRHGLSVGLITNQSGIARGRISEEEANAVNERLRSLLGGLDTVVMCPHGPDDACGCRKPRPGLVWAAAKEMGVDPSACVVIGDILADVAAGEAAGGRGILVPNGATRPEEAGRARYVTADLAEAVDLALAWSRR